MFTVLVGLLSSPAFAQQIIVTSDNQLQLYDPDGALVSSRAIPYPGGNRPVSEQARDVVHVGKYVVVYNGTFDPYVSALNTKTRSWTDLTMSGWTTVNNTSYGGIAVLPPYVYVTDMTTYGSAVDELAGIVRFDAGSGGATRYQDPREYIDLTLGLDGDLYALGADERTVRALDPISMAELRSFTLVNAVRGIAVSSNGVIWGASWDDSVYAFSPVGDELGRYSNVAFDLIDVDVNEDDVVVVGSRFGEVILIDGPQFIETGRFVVPGSNTTFVAFRN